MKPIIFWGATGHAKVLNEFIGDVGYRLVATFDNNPAVTQPFKDIPLYHGREGFRAWYAVQKSESVAFLVAIGGARGWDRFQIQQMLMQNGLSPIVVIHPKAFVARDALLGQGSQVMAQAAVCTETIIGEACIVNTSATVDHECVLGNGVHIAPGAVLTGCVHVGDYSLIGAGAVVLPRITIGRNTTIGAGAVVTQDIPDNCVAYGNPARIVRDHPDIS